MRSSGSPKRRSSDIRAEQESSHSRESESEVRWEDVVVRLDELAAVVPDAEDEWSDAFEVIARLEQAIEGSRPAYLRNVSGEWKAPYLELHLSHVDGTDVDVIHGDGYTAITGGPLAYRHYLNTEELVTVVSAALEGVLTYVRRDRFGRLVDSYFTVPGADRRLGADSLKPARLVAWLPGADRRLRVTFSDPNAFAPA
jgi:hypothetical protein